MTRSSNRLASAIRSDLTRPGQARRHQEAQSLDAWLAQVFQATLEATGTAPAGLALAAVGGHARRDSGPAGDLDLVLLHDDAIVAAHLAELADRIWYPVWDEGFRLDHSIRSPRSARDVARSDLAVAAGLLDLRVVAGDAELVSGVRARLGQDWRSAARRRLPEVALGMKERLDRHGDLANLLEPDLKHARGGLRDAVMIDALVATWLADSPHDWRASRDRLLDVRDALHAVAGRGVERLTLADQDAVAAALGAADADELLTDVSACGRRIGYALDQTLRSAVRATERGRGPRRLSAPRLQTVEPGVAVHENEVVTIPGSTLEAADPLLPLRTAAVAARTGLPLSPATAAALAHLATTRPLPPVWPAAARDALVDVLAAGPALPALWETLDHAGLVTTWLPPWQDIRSRPQRNAVHRFTVDRHSVQTCVEAAALGVDVERPDLLLLACLLHDIGKLPGERDHPAVGARIAARLCTGLGLIPADVAVVERLVAHHLTLVELATRRDPDDPRTVEALAVAVDHDAGVLDLLRALTEADARAAGPAAWTRWRQRLVDDLVTRARTVLAGRPAPAPSPLTPDELAVVAEVGRTGRPAAQVSLLADSAAVMVAARDRPGLFADVAGLLAAQGAGVRTALIRTVDGIAVDTWWCSRHRGVDPAVLLTGLERLERGDAAVLDRLTRRDAAYRPPPGVNRATQVFLVPDASTDSSVVEVRALDRPGLLHRLGTALRDAEVDIRSAHVATLAGRAVDVLYLAEAGGGALNPARTAQVISLLGRAVGEA